MSFQEFGFESISRRQVLRSLEVILKLVDVLFPELEVGLKTFGRSLRSPDVGQTLDRRLHGASM
jgi:hypothetical protein